jgi:hypothetical protein
MALPDIAMKLKGKSPMIVKTVEPDSMTAHNILDMTKNLPPSDLQWLVRQLGNHYSEGSKSEELNAESGHPWLKYAGIFADDPDWESFQELLEQYRKEIDADS